MKKYIQDFFIIRKLMPGGNHIIFELLCPTLIPEIHPGQFAEVLIPNTADVYLRRPFSIHDVDKGSNSISLFIKVAGKGTQALKKLSEGDKLNLVYPLGTGFAIPDDKSILLVGGGCGVAPLLFLAHRLHDSGYNPDILIGSSSADEIHEIKKYEQYGSLHLITEDGSLGEKGLVTHHSIFLQKSFSYKNVFACGPEGMLKAVNNAVKNRGAKVYVSLENTMACGIGACLSCVVNTTSGNRCVCTDGPVFNTKELTGW